MECSRDTFDLVWQQQTVLAASQPTKLELRLGVSGLCDYFTLNSSGFEEDTCEIEIISFYGRTNLKVLTDTVRGSFRHIGYAPNSLSSRQ
jgi:hypothetical protein